MRARPFRRSLLSLLPCGRALRLPLSRSGYQIHVGFSLLPSPLGEAEWRGGVGVGWARRDGDEDDAVVGPDTQRHRA